jgi:DMSO/TMAO reductase YedYZ molybdopterin-dependent catalytic subunit
MTDMATLSRRTAIFSGLAGSSLLGGCARIFGADRLTAAAGFQPVLNAEQTWTLESQRFLLSGGAMAREYARADISPRFKANGTLHPAGDDYAQAVAENFANWRLGIDGMVARPMSLSIAELRRLPARTQITRHDCVEGWSAIAGWTGVPLGLLLTTAGVAPRARYAVFHCADNLDGEPAKGGAQSPGQYYESIALVDAFHPQTLVAYAMNGLPLEIAHGAPLRLRVERQLGYKQAKYLQRIELTDSFSHIAGGRGGYWEDRGYEWYAGI